VCDSGGAQQGDSDRGQWQGPEDGGMVTVTGERDRDRRTAAW